MITQRRSYCIGDAQSTFVQEREKTLCATCLCGGVQRWGPQCMWKNNLRSQKWSEGRKWDLFNTRQVSSRWDQEGICLGERNWASFMVPSGHPWVNVPPILWLRLGVSLLNLPGMPTAVTAGSFPLWEGANVLSWKDLPSLRWLFCC